MTNPAVKLLSAFGGGTSSGTQTFTYSGAYEEWEVPAGVTTITVDAYGAEGGGEYAGTTLRGAGGRVKCDVSVTPGETLRVYVGQQGATASSITNDVPTSFPDGANAWNGAGAGGGSSHIRRTPYGTSDRLVIAPGGGGAGSNNGSASTGGGGGGGEPNGTAGQNGISGPTGGGGATQSAGGTAGTGSVNGTAGGANGDGGAGGNGSRGGGGGGGGYYGGGGGGAGGTGTAGGGGGGGSGLSTGVNETIQNGVQTGNGELTITW